MNNEFLFSSMVTLIVLLAGTNGSAGDWPTWRYDARRSAASPEELPRELRLQWLRELPRAARAWPNEPRLSFDLTYEPIATKKMLLFGSPQDGSVTACDTDTGEVRWRFFTEGPVRFAPVAHRDKIYVASDDGYLYCLDAADGKLLWKFRGAPSDLPERRHLGNGRLISFWPIRGGPVLADETIYFAAGIWPSMGVFVVAVDAETGKLQWRNDGLNRIENVRLDHNELKTGGLSPQGYLVVDGDTLLVPNGRAMPAGLDRKTGKLLYYLQGGRRGDCRVTAMNNYAFVGGLGVIDVRTGREVGSRAAEAGDQAPVGCDHSKLHLFESPHFPYKLFSGCSAFSMLVPDVAYDFTDGKLTAFDLHSAKVSEYEADFRGDPLKPWRWDAPVKWTFAPVADAETGAGPGFAIKTGNRVFGSFGRMLMGIDLPDIGNSEPRVTWKTPWQGAVTSMIAADGKLFVVTEDGRIGCFGAKKVEPRSFDLVSRKPKQVTDKWTLYVRGMLQQSQVAEGYCLVLGVGSGRLIDELLRQTQLKVIGVGVDRQRVDSLRELLIASGHYGTRVELLVGDPDELILPPYLASLIVSESGIPVDFPVTKLLDVLRPYGGVAWFEKPVVAQEPSWFHDVEKRIVDAGLQGFHVQRSGNFKLVRRVGSLPDSASWTHESADAARTFFSADQRVKSPLGILWYGDGDGYGFLPTSGPSDVAVRPQVVGGRLFALQRRTSLPDSSDKLHAYDVYTGRLLWKTDAPELTRFVSTKDGIYAARRDRVTVYDLATGRQRAEFRPEVAGGQSPVVVGIRVSDDVVLAAFSFKPSRLIVGGMWDSTLLVAMDHSNGRELWRRKALLRFNNSAIVMGNGTVFCIDSTAPFDVDRARRRGDKQAENEPSTIVALEARSGKVKWTQLMKNPYKSIGRHSLYVRSYDDGLAYCDHQNVLLAGKYETARAYAADDGTELWHASIPGGQPWMVSDKTLIDQGGGEWDIATGESIRRIPFHTGYGCNHAVASRHLVTMRNNTASCFDLVNNKTMYMRNTRSGCTNNLIVADGVLSVPLMTRCNCNYSLQTCLAMIHMPEAASWDSQTVTKQQLELKTLQIQSFVEKPDEK